MAESANLAIEVNSKGVVVATKRLKGLEIQGVRTSKATNTLGRSAKGMTASFIKGGLALGGITSGIILLRQEAIRFVSANVKFEKSMSGVLAVTRATAGEMKLMTEQAKKLGEGTIFSASQASEGMRFLGQAGFEASEILQAMPGLLDLASAGSLGLAEASDIASNIMAGFNINAEESIRVADVMAKIASNANTNIQQLGDGMKYVAPLASALGISLEETASAMGILSDAGIQADMAGTGLRQILASLLATTPKAERALDRLGLSMADVSPQTHSLSEIIETLAEANIGATEATEIFGRRGVSALLALTSKVPRLRELNAELANSGNFAKETAEILTDNLAGSVTKFSSAVEGATLRIGEASGFTSTLRDATDALTAFFLELGKTNEELLREKPIEETIARITQLEAKLIKFAGNKRALGGVRKQLQELRKVRDEFFNADSTASEDGLSQSLDRVRENITSTTKEIEEMSKRIEVFESKVHKINARGTGKQRPATALREEREELEKKLEILRETERVVGSQRAEQQEANPVQFGPENATVKEIQAIRDKEEIIARAVETEAKRRQDNIEGVIAYISTEEELIAMQYERRRQLILDNTAMNSQNQQVMLDQLRERMEEELMMVEEQRSAKVDAIEEELMTDEQRLIMHHEKKRQIILEAEGKTAEERTKLLAKLDKKHGEDLTKLEFKRNKARLDSAQKLFGNLTTIAGVFAGEQKGIMQGLFAVNKGFQVAQAVMEIQGALSKAWNSAPFPANIGAVASVASGTAGIISSITGSNFSAREHGGLIPAGQMGLVGESGPELVSGPMNVLSTRTTAGRGGGGGTTLKIEVINKAGVSVSVESDEENKRARIIIETAKAEATAEMRGEFSEDTLAGSLKTGQGILPAVLEQTYNLQRI